MSISITRIVLILLLLINSVIVHFVTAQNFSIGGKAAPLIVWPNYADQNDKDQFNSKIHPGFILAGFISFPMNKENTYDFVAEAGLSIRGRTVTFNDNVWTNKSTYYFGETSMLLRRKFKFQLGPDIPADWFINMGPRISYWIGGNGKVSAGGSYTYKVVFEPMPESPPSPDFDKIYMTDINRWLFGVDLGVGFNAPINPRQKIFTELRFTSGHTFFGTPTSATNRTLGFIDSMKWNEKFISLSVAYSFYFDVRERKMGRSNKDKDVKRKPIKRKKY